MDRTDPTRNGYLGGMEDGVGRGGQIRPDPVFRLPGFQMNHPDLGEFPQHGAGRQFLEFLLTVNQARISRVIPVSTP